MSGRNYDRSKKSSILNPAVSYAFALQVEAMFMLPCRSIRVFTKENEFDYYQEGGLNDYVHMLRKPISKPFTFQVERYVGVSASADFNSGFLDPLTLGTDLVLPLILYVNRSPSPGWIDNMDFKNCARAYIFTGCTVTSKEFGELNAEQSKLLTETTTIAYRELITINQLSPAWEKGGVWKYPGEGQPYTGDPTGTSHDDNKQAATTSTNLSVKNSQDHSKNKFASKWEYPDEKSSYTGSTDDGKARIQNRNNGNNAKNLSKSDMTKSSNNDRAKLWGYPKDTDPYTGTGTSSTLNRSKNDSKSTREGAKSLWGYPSETDAYTGTGASHYINRSKNDSKDTREKEKSLWGYPSDKDPYTGTGASHDANRSDNESKSEREDEKSLWEYPALTDPYTGKGDSHDSNRSKNMSKEEMEKSASIYPPNRRALMADSLSS